MAAVNPEVESTQYRLRLRDGVLGVALNLFLPANRPRRRD